MGPVVHGPIEVLDSTWVRRSCWRAASSDEARPGAWARRARRLATGARESRSAPLARCAPRGCGMRWLARPRTKPREGAGPSTSAPGSNLTDDVFNGLLDRHVRAVHPYRVVRLAQRCDQPRRILLVAPDDVGQ